MATRRVRFNKVNIALVKALAIVLTVAIHLNPLQKSIAEQPRSRPPKLAQLAYFQGKWVCQIQDVGATASELAGEMTWNVINQTDRQAYRVQGAYVRNRERSKKIFIHGLMTYDAASDRFVQTVSTNDDSKLIFNSVGWQGEEFVWQGDQTRQEGDYILRRTITKKSDRQFEASYVALNPTDSKWYPVTNMVCNK